MEFGNQPHLSKRAFVGLVCASLLVPLNSTMIAVALPRIGTDLAVSADTLTLLLVVGYLLTNVVMQSLGGWLGDTFGQLRVLRIGRATFLVATLAAVLAPYLSALVAARVLMAAAGSMIVPVAVAVMRRNVPAARRPRAFGLYSSLLSGAAALGPPLGGFLTNRFGWRSLFLSNLPLLAASWVFGDRSDAPARVGGRTAVDWVGICLLALGLAACVLAIKGSQGHPALLLIGGIVLLVGFGLWERRTAAPLIDLGLFRRGEFVAGVGVVALQYFAAYSLLFLVPFLLTTHRSFEPSQVGFALLGLTFGNVIFAPVGARLAERVGYRNAAVAGSSLGVVGMVALFDLLKMDTAGAMSFWMFLVGGGQSICIGPAQAAAMGAVPKVQSGTAAGVMSTLRYLAGLFGVALISAMLARGKWGVLPRPATAIHRGIRRFGGFVTQVAVAAKTTG